MLFIHLQFLGRNLSLEPNYTRSFHAKILTFTNVFLLEICLTYKDNGILYKIRAVNISAD